MPNIDVAMARSLRGGAWSSIADGLSANIRSRQISDSVNDVGEAFSSWDNCMERSFCKWPVIAVIIIGGLIIFSIIWCLARCLCCGLSCCCQCFSCLKCCGNCCGCCDPPGDKKHKYLDEPYAAGPHDQGYKSQAPMFAPAPPPVHVHVNGGQNNNAASNPPQYAEFEVGGGGNKRDSNALPAMPTWEGSQGKKVSLEDVNESVEMEPMKKPLASQSVQSINTEPTVPLMGQGAPNPTSPAGGRSPYGPPQGGPGGYGQQRDPYGPPGGQGYDGYSDNGYGDSGYGQTEAGYGAGAAAAGMAMGAAGRRGPGTPQQDRGHGSQRRPGYAGPGNGGPRSPGFQQGYNNGYDQPGSDGYGQQQDVYGAMPPRGPPSRGTPSPGPNGGRGGYPPRTGPSPGPGGRGFPPRANTGSPGPGGMGYPNRTGPSPGPGGRGYPARSSPSPAPAGYRRSPAPQENPYGGGGGGNQYSESAYDRPQYAQAPPQPHYSDIPASPVSPALQNNGGFDFHSGYSRPSTRDGHNASPAPMRPGHEERPPPSSSSELAYPGFKAYQPPQQGWSGV